MRNIPLRLLCFILFTLALISLLKMRGQEKLFIGKNGAVYTIMNFELPPNEDSLRVWVADIKAAPPIQKGVSPADAVRTNIYYDFGFMTGIFGFIFCICLAARRLFRQKPVRTILYALAMAQILAIAFDLVEDLYILHWFNQPLDEIMLPPWFKPMVYIKFLLPVTAFLTAFFSMIWAATGRRSIA